MKEVNNMKHEELTLTELKEWAKGARNLVDMFNNDELELVDCTIDPMENVVDNNQADEMAQYQELAKEVEDSDKEVREIVCYEYDDTIGSL